MEAEVIRAIFLIFCVVAGIGLGFALGFLADQIYLLLIIGLISIALPGFLLVGQSPWIYLIGVIIIPCCIWLGNFVYKRNYPTFQNKPYKEVTDVNGNICSMYITQSKGKYFIGLIYLEEADGSWIWYRTRWLDRFPDFASAQTELLRRYDIPSSWASNFYKQRP
jgi:hypothetical protein